MPEYTSEIECVLGSFEEHTSDIQCLANAFDVVITEIQCLAVETFYKSDRQCCFAMFDTDESEIECVFGSFATEENELVCAFNMCFTLETDWVCLFKSYDIKTTQRTCSVKSFAIHVLELQCFCSSFNELHTKRTCVISVEGVSDRWCCFDWRYHLSTPQELTAIHSHIRDYLDAFPWIDGHTESFEQCHGMYPWISLPEVQFDVDSIQIGDMTLTRDEFLNYRSLVYGSLYDERLKTERIINRYYYRNEWQQSENPIFVKLRDINRAIDIITKISDIFVGRWTVSERDCLAEAWGTAASERYCYVDTFYRSDRVVFVAKNWESNRGCIFGRGFIHYDQERCSSLKAVSGLSDRVCIFEGTQLAERPCFIGKAFVISSSDRFIFTKTEFETLCFVGVPFDVAESEITCLVEKSYKSDRLCLIPDTFYSSVRTCNFEGTYLSDISCFSESPFDTLLSDRDCRFGAFNGLNFERTCLMELTYKSDRFCIVTKPEYQVESEITCSLSSFDVVTSEIECIVADSFITPNSDRSCCLSLFHIEESSRSCILENIAMLMDDIYSDRTCILIFEV